MSSVTSPPAEPTRAILDWLAQAPASDPEAELGLLEQHLTTLHAASMSSQSFQHFVERIVPRARALAIAHRFAQKDASEPMVWPLLARARRIAQALQQIALDTERVLTDAEARLGMPQKRFTEALPAGGIGLLVEQLLVLEQAGFDPEPEMWRLAARLYALSRNPERVTPAASPAEAALNTYKLLIALPTTAPHELTPAELEWTANFVRRACHLLHVQEQRPPALDGAWYWLDPLGTAEPCACARREAPAGRPLLYFSTRGLARQAREALQHGAEPASAGVHLPAQLERLQARWSIPPLREQPRRRQDYPVQACVGLNAIWAALREGDEHLSIPEWSVLNESPGGFAIMNVHGRAAGVLAGVPVALRRKGEREWTLCVVRWIRSDALNLVEIGLQMLSRGALPVRIAFRGTDDITHALALPMLGAQRQHQAILAPVGSYASRRFTLLSDVDRVYVAQCRLLSLDLQTACVELFQFEIDPYPL